MKTLKLLRMDKKYAIQFTILPIFSIMFLAFVYSKVFILNIPFGVVDHDNSSLSRKIVQQLDTHPGINVKYYTDSEEQLADAIKVRTVNGGIVIPKGFHQDILEKKSPGVSFIIDGTNNIVSANLSGYCSTVLSTISSQLQVGILQGNKMLPYSAKQAIKSFSFEERVLYDSQLGYLSFLGYLIIPLTVQMIFLADFLVPVLIEERKKFCTFSMKINEKRQQIQDLITRILMLIGILIISGFIGLCAAGKFFGMQLRGSILMYAVLMLLFLVNLTAMGFFFASFIDTPIYFTMFLGMINLITALTCLITWPAYMIPAGAIRLVKSLWPFIHAVLPLKYLNLKGADLSVLLPYIKESLLYTVFWLPVGVGLYFVRIRWQTNRYVKLPVEE